MLNQDIICEDFQKIENPFLEIWDGIKEITTDCESI
jgi:hypothetical protein